MRRTVRFTNTTLGQMRNEEHTAIEFTDSEVRSLKVQLTITGRKVFLVRLGVKVAGVYLKRAARIGEFPVMKLEEARQRALEMTLAVRRGENPFETTAGQTVEPDSMAMTLNQFFAEHYYPHAQQTKRSHREDFQNFHVGIGKRHGTLPLAELTTALIQRFLDDGMAAWKPATRNRHLALVRRMLHLAVTWGYLVRNPAAGISQLRENNRRNRFLAGDELRRFLEAVYVEPNRTVAGLILFLLATGVRRSEAMLAERVHLDENRRTLWLPQTKAGEGRFVLLNDLAFTALGMVEPKPDNPYLFPGRIAGKHVVDPTPVLERIKARAGITNLRLHDLRHTFCSLAVSNGASLYEVQHLVGHKSSTTTQRYAHLLDDSLRRASSFVASAIEGVCL